MKSRYQAPKLFPLNHSFVVLSKSIIIIFTGLCEGDSGSGLWATKPESGASRDPEYELVAVFTANWWPCGSIASMAINVGEEQISQWINVYGVD